MFGLNFFMMDSFDLLVMLKARSNFIAAWEVNIIRVNMVYHDVAICFSSRIGPHCWIADTGDRRWQCFT